MSNSSRICSNFSIIISNMNVINKMVIIMPLENRHIQDTLSLTVSIHTLSLFSPFLQSQLCMLETDSEVGRRPRDRPIKDETPPKWV